MSHVTRRRVCGTPIVGVSNRLAANCRPLAPRMNVTIKPGLGGLRNETYGKYIRPSTIAACVSQRRTIYGV